MSRPTPTDRTGDDAGEKPEPPKRNAFEGFVDLTDSEITGFVLTLGTPADDREVPGDDDQDEAADED